MTILHLGLVGAGSASAGGESPNARQWLVAIRSLRLGLHIAISTAGISDDPRYAAFAKEWGADASQRTFVHRILIYVTGIFPLEQQILHSRGERYRSWPSRTSKFLPLPRMRNP
jgi:steroid 5-alpha reductase family enzyme